MLQAYHKQKWTIIDVSERVSVCVRMQAVQQDPRVTQLVKDLNTSIQAAAEQCDSGDSIPAVLVLNKVSMTSLSHPLIVVVASVYLSACSVGRVASLLRKYSSNCHIGSLL